MAKRPPRAFSPPPGYLNSDAAARYLGFPSAKAFRQWTVRVGIPTYQRAPGRVLLWRQADLDATIIRKA